VKIGANGNTGLQRPSGSPDSPEPLFDRLRLRLELPLHCCRLSGRQIMIADLIKNLLELLEGRDRNRTRVLKPPREALGVSPGH
jgi:hypothetical protein